MLRKAELAVEGIDRRNQHKCVLPLLPSSVPMIWTLAHRSLPLFPLSRAIQEDTCLRTIVGPFSTDFRGGRASCQPDMLVDMCTLRHSLSSEAIFKSLPSSSPQPSNCRTIHETIMKDAISKLRETESSFEDNTAQRAIFFTL